MSFNGNLQPTTDSGYDLANKGSIHTHDSSANTGLTVSGNNGFVLSENSSTSTGLEWIAAAGGGIEESFTITGSGTTTPTSQTGFKGIIMDLRDVTGGSLTCNVDGSSYVVGAAGNAYALAVNPSSALNFVAAGTGRQLTTASYVQASNETTSAPSPIGLWCDPTGSNWGHGGGLSDGHTYGCMSTSTQWDITDFDAALDLYGENISNSNRCTGVTWRYTGNGTTEIPRSPMSVSGTTYGGNYANCIQDGAYYPSPPNYSGTGFAKYDTYATNDWRAGNTMQDKVVKTDPVENDMMGLDTNLNGQIYFTTGRQHDKIYKWEIPTGNIFGNSGYIDNSTSAANSGLGVCAATTNGDACIYQDKDISAQLTDMVDVSFTADGLWCIVAGASGNLFSYILTGAYDLTTATYDQTYSTSAQSTSIGGVQVKSDGSRVYVLDSTSAPNSILEYNSEGALAGTARVVIIG